MQPTRSTFWLLGIGMTVLSLTAAAQTGISAGTAANATGTASGSNSSVGGGLGVSGAGSTAPPSGAPSIPGAGATGSTNGAIVIQPSTPTPPVQSMPSAGFNSSGGVGAFSDPSNPSGAGLGVGGTGALGTSRPGTR